MLIKKDKKLLVVNNDSVVEQRHKFRAVNWGRADEAVGSVSQRADVLISNIVFGFRPREQRPRRRRGHTGTTFSRPASTASMDHCYSCGKQTKQHFSVVADSVPDIGDL